MRRAYRLRIRNGAFVSPLARIVRTKVMGEPIFFTVQNRRDEIQRYHLAGQFYEREELAIIARHFPLGGVFFDVGTNIGNHTLYVAKFLRAARVVTFEPNPTAISLLKSNIALNGLNEIVDTQFLGVGLSDGSAQRGAVQEQAFNLGATRMNVGEGDIPLAALDDLVGGQRPDMIKIDVEGMELMVLAGMKGLVAEARPAIFIEVEVANVPAVKAWAKAHHYEIAEEFQRYPENTNFMMIAK